VLHILTLAIFLSLLPTHFNALGATNEPFLLNHRVWSTDTYSRVVLYLSQAADYSLQKDNAKEWVVRVKNTQVPKFLSGNLKVNDQLIKDITAVNELNHLRVTIRTKVDLAQVEKFLFHEPVRIVLDLYKHEQPKAEDAIGDLLKKQSTAVPIIVIDPGHGGKDPGTISASGIQEKDVTLAISLMIKENLHGLGLDRVFLTRTTDHTIDLDERTYFANSKAAHIFVSIHANSSNNRHSQGLQTFYLNLASDRASTRLAARENLFKAGRTVDMIKLDLEVAMHGNRSVGFAQSLHSHVYKRLSQANREMQDLGVKPALFYVLWGARMPSILVETGFLSHPQEAKKLAKKSYQMDVAKAISDGIHRYLTANRLI
jgi:N-acetylmuramoyl-L-alanine amidase